MLNQEKLPEAAQKVENGGSTVQEESSSYEAVMAKLAEGVDENAMAILPTKAREVRAGGGKVYNHDSKRPVKFYHAKGGSQELSLVKRVNKDTGVYINKFRSIENGFGLFFFKHKKGDQVTLLLNNGKTLVGHIVSSKNVRGFYFPKKSCKGIVTPAATTGEEIPIIVLSIIVG